MMSTPECVPATDPDYVQFGSSEWFWRRHPNSHVQQNEPTRFKDPDEAIIDHREARHIERVRDRFFDQFGEIKAKCARP